MKNLVILSKKGVGSIVLLVFLFLTPPRQVNAQDYHKRYARGALTEDEARDFMQKFLWFRLYDYGNYSNPKEKFSTFFGKQVNNPALVYPRIDLTKAMVSQVQLPEVEVLLTHLSGGLHFVKKQTYRLEKKNGYISLIPQIRYDVDGIKFNPYWEEERIENRRIRDEEYVAIRKDLIEYFQFRYPGPTSNHYINENLYGRWVIDSFYLYLNERPEEASKFGDHTWFFNPGGALLTMLSEDKMKVGQFSEESGDWWFLWKDKIAICQDHEILIYTIEEYSPYRVYLSSDIRSERDILLRLWDKKKDYSWKYKPQSIEHPSVEVVHQAKYSRINASRDNKSFISMKIFEEAGILNAKGEWIVPLNKYQIYYYPHDEGGKLLFTYSKNKWNGIDTLGNVLRTFTQEEMDEYYAEYQRKNPRKNYNYKGEEGDGLLGAKIVQADNGKYGVIDSLGNQIIASRYDKIFPRAYEDYYRVYLDGNEGIIRADGEIVLKPIFKNFGTINDSVYFLRNWEKREVKLYHAKQDRILEELTSEEISLRGAYTELTQGGKRIMLDSFMHIIKIPGYENFYYAGDDLFGIQKGSKKGLIDRAGHVILPFEYDVINAFDGLIKVQKKGKWGILNQKREVIIPIEYDFIKFGPYIIGFDDDMDEIDSSTMFVARKNGKDGLLSLSGETLLPFTYETLSAPVEPYEGFGEKWCLFKENKKNGYVNLSGEVKIPAKYDELDPPQYSENKGFLHARKGFKRGIIDLNNQIGVPFIFDEIIEIPGSPLLIVWYKGYYGLIRNPSFIQP